MSFWIYILKCVDGSYYTGHTNNLEKRLAAHNKEKSQAIHAHDAQSYWSSAKKWTHDKTSLLANGKQRLEPKEKRSAHARRLGTTLEVVERQEESRLGSLCYTFQCQCGLANTKDRQITRDCYFNTFILCCSKHHPEMGKHHPELVEGSNKHRIHQQL